MSQRNGIDNIEYSGTTYANKNVKIRKADIALEQQLPTMSYTKLHRIASQVLDEQPDNAVDTLEDISKEIKRSKFTSAADTILDKTDR